MKWNGMKGHLSRRIEYQFKSNIIYVDKIIQFIYLLDTINHFILYSKQLDRQSINNLKKKTFNTTKYYFRLFRTENGILKRKLNIRIS